MIVGDNTVIINFKGDEIMPLITIPYILLGSGMVYSGLLTLAGLLN